MLNRGCHFNPYLQNSWSKHGQDKFVFEVLLELGVDDYLLEWEELFFRADKPELNATYVAVGSPLKGKKHTAESRRRMTDGQYAYWERRRREGGGKLTETHKKKIQKKAFGRKHSEESKSKMGESAKSRRMTKKIREGNRRGAAKRTGNRGRFNPDLNRNEKLYDAIKDGGWSFKRLGGEVGLSAQGLHNVVMGKVKKPSKHIVESLCSILGVKRDEVGL